jgi:cyclic 2,3-diphosphoglycerate synthetase
VVRDALARLGGEHEVTGVLFVGGEEKVGPLVRSDPELHYGCAVGFAGAEPERALRDLATATPAEAVVDLSGEPVLDAEGRLRLASVALALGMEFQAPGMSLRPVSQEDLGGSTPIVSVIGTGKRSGKTAVCGHLAGLLRERSVEPVIVSMGRGGPARPSLVEGGELRGLEGLLQISRRGEHASSDYLEDAVLTGAATVGCRRCGEGPAGEVHDSNVVEGARLALSLGRDAVLIEGSGAALPPVAAHRTVCVVSAAAARPQALSHLGPYRLLRSHLVVLVGAGQIPAGDRESLVGELEAWTASGVVIGCDLIPEPVRLPAEGTAVAAFTTGGPAASERLRESLAAAGLEVRLVSGNLARRAALAEDLNAARREGCTVYMTELKAAAIDTVAERAEREGAEVVFIRNRPVPLPGGPDLDTELLRMVAEARSEARPAGRHSEAAGREPAAAS